MRADRRFLHLLYASVAIAFVLAYTLAVTQPAYGTAMGDAHKAYTPFDEPIPKTPQEIVADKRLDQKVKVFCKSRNLKGLFADLSAKTGVKLSTTREISSQRPIIYFHSRPLRDVMTEISAVYGYHWLISGKPGAYEYQLFEDAVRAKRRGQVTQDLKAEQDALLLDFTDRMLNGEAEKTLDPISQTNPTAYNVLSSANQKRTMDLFTEFGITFLSQVLMNGTSVSRCGDLPLQTQTAICDWYNRVQQNMRVVPVVAIGPGGQQISPEEIQAQQQAQPPVSPGDMADATLIMNRIASDSAGMPRFELILNRQSGNGMRSFKTDWPAASLTADDLRQATDLPVAEKVLGDTVLPDDPKITIDKLRWLPYRKGLLLGDLLEAIAVQSGRDVIADYYLQDKTSQAVKDQPLRKFAESLCKQFEYTCQVEANTLRFRQNKWYTQEMHIDPPADVLDGLWSKIEANGALTVRDLRPIAELSDDQMKWPGWKLIPGADVACRWPCTVRLWGSLSDAQDKTARSGGLPVSQLLEDQRRKLDDLVAERKISMGPQVVDAARISMSTVKPEMSTTESGGRVVTFKNVSSTGTPPPGGMPAPSPGQGGGSNAPKVMTWSGSPGAGASGGAGGFMSTNQIGDAQTWLARMSSSQNEMMVLIEPKSGEMASPISLQMPQPISEAERKEVIAQRKADRDAEVIELVQ